MINKERLDRINTLDLIPIKDYLGQYLGWNKNFSDEIGAEYRKFWFLMGKYGPDAVLPWNKNILSFWKAHILHTRKYFEDCQMVFGFYLHYNPSASAMFKSGASQINPVELLAKTIEVYTKEYNQPPSK